MMITIICHDDTKDDTENEEHHEEPVMTSQDKVTDKVQHNESI